MTKKLFVLYQKLNKNETVLSIGYEFKKVEIVSENEFNENTTNSRNELDLSKVIEIALKNEKHYFKGKIN